MGSHFFAMMSRMKYINRWSLMRNSYTESLSEHSLEVAMLAHLLAVLGNKRLGKMLDVQMAALLGIYHDAAEIITGDMPTPVKYFNPHIRGAFRDVETDAVNRLLGMLPEDLKDTYDDIFYPAEEYTYESKLVKAADKLSALLKCVEERKAGNQEFAHAEKTTQEAINCMALEEVGIFMEEFYPSYSLTLDELNG